MRIQQRKRRNRAEIWRAMISKAKGSISRTVMSKKTQNKDSNAQSTYRSYKANGDFGKGTMKSEGRVEDSFR